MWFIKSGKSREFYSGNTGLYLFPNWLLHGQTKTIIQTPQKLYLHGL